MRKLNPYTQMEITNNFLCGVVAIVCGIGAAYYEYKENRQITKKAREFKPDGATQLLGWIWGLGPLREGGYEDLKTRNKLPENLYEYLEYIEYNTPMNRIVEGEFMNEVLGENVTLKVVEPNIVTGTVKKQETLDKILKQYNYMYTPEAWDSIAHRKLEFRILVQP